MFAQASSLQGDGGGLPRLKPQPNYIHSIWGLFAHCCPGNHFQVELEETELGWEDFGKSPSTGIPPGPSPRHAPFPTRALLRWQSVERVPCELAHLGPITLTNTTSPSNQPTAGRTGGPNKSFLTAAAPLCETRKDLCACVSCRLETINYVGQLNLFLQHNKSGCFWTWFSWCRSQKTWNQKHTVLKIKISRWKVSKNEMNVNICTRENKSCLLLQNIYVTIKRKSVYICMHKHQCLLNIECLAIWRIIRSDFFFLIEEYIYFLFVCCF